jgi:hypothetical protein
MCNSDDGSTVGMGGNSSSRGSNSRVIDCGDGSTSGILVARSPEVSAKSRVDDNSLCSSVEGE